MNRKIYKSKAIYAVIILTAAILLASLWPLRLWHETVTGSVKMETGMTTELVDENRMITQSFIAQYEHLDTISLYVAEMPEGESFWARIFSDDQKQLVEEKITVDKEKLPGYVSMIVDVDLEVGNCYHLIVQGKESGLIFGYEYVDMEAEPQLSLMYYGADILEEMNLVADYNWTMPLRKEKTVLFGGMILLLATVLLLGVRLYYKKKPNADKFVTVERVFKFVANPLVAVFVLGCLIAVVMGAFGPWALDKTFYFISVLLLGGVLFYGINHKREGQTDALTLEKFKAKLPDILQIFFIMCVVSACCEYRAGLYNVHLAIALRKEMFWLALVMISMFGFKEIFNLYNLVYGIVAGILGFLYYRAKWTPEMGEMSIVVLRYEIVAVILLGMVVIRTVIGLCKKKLTKVHFPLAAFLLAFWGITIWFRNGRWWMVTHLIVFSLLYLSYGMWEKNRERFLINVCKGILLQFVVATGWALLYRPLFIIHGLIRYSHILYTATAAAVYLSVVMCAATVVLLAKLQKSMKLRDVWKELVLFGTVVTYIMLTMSRNGLLTGVVAVCTAIILITAGKGKKKLFGCTKSLCMMILAVVISFPIIYTAQRNLPILVSKPYCYDIVEDASDYVLRGHRMDSKRFTRIDTFAKVFAYRVFTIPAGDLDIYEEQEKKVEAVPTEETPQETVNALREDYSNGRFEIWKPYIENINMTGHKEETPEGIYSYAHNTYLEVVWTHGMIAGVLFVLLIIVAFVYALKYFRKNKDRTAYAGLPAVAIMAVMVLGLNETTYLAGDPSYMLLLLVMAPLLFREKTSAITEKQSIEIR